MAKRAEEKDPELLWGAQQNYSCLQSNCQWKALRHRKDALQLKMERRNYGEIGRRGRLTTIKSHTPRRVTPNCRIIALQRLSLRNESSEPQVGLSNQRFSRKGDPQSIWLWRPVELSFGRPTGLEEFDFTLKCHAQHLTDTRTQDKRSNYSIRAWAIPTWWFCRISWRGGVVVGGQLWLTLGTKTLVADILETGILLQEHCCWWLPSWLIIVKAKSWSKAC